MANYSLVVGSKFSPFTYQELLEPAVSATKAHQELENQYSELSTKANVWEGLANEQTDPEAYATYKAYSDELKNQAGQLASQGLSVGSRKSIADLRSRYSSDILPIENAYTRRKELADEQRKLRNADNTLMFDVDASTLSLDDLIKNPQLGYQSYSGALIAKQVGDAAKNLAKQMRNNPREWESILGNQYFQTLMQKGYTTEEILLAASQDPNAPTALTNLVNTAVESTGISNWKGVKDAEGNLTEYGQQLLGKARDYGVQGLWNAVGDTQYQVQSNKAYDYAMREAAAIRAEEREQRRREEQAAQARLNGLAINPLNIYSSRELSASEKDYNDSMQKYSKYFEEKNGEWTMNEAGWKEYNRNTRESKKTGPLGVSGKVISAQVRGENPDHTEFRRFMDSMGITMSSESFDSSQGKAAGTIWGDYAKESPMAKTARYDATKVTEFDYPIAGAQQGDMKDAIMTAGRGLSLKEVDYDSKSKQFKDTGEEITMEDLKNDKYKVTATRFSPYGTTVMIQDDKGNVRRFRMPAGINTTNEQNRDGAMSAANKWQQVVNTGQYTDAKGNIHYATPDEIAYAKQQYAQAIQQAYLYHSQLGVQNKTKEQEFNTYGY